jgi:peptide/nickel transport system substrate-binding protein
MMKRQHLITLLLVAAVAGGAGAQTRKDSAIIGMTLEPPGLDPTTNPAAAVGEIVHYNVLEGLTKVPPMAACTPSGCSEACAFMMARRSTRPT